MFEGYKILNTVSFFARLLLYYFMNYYNIISNETIENVTLKYDLEIVPSMIGMNVIENIINILLLIFVVIQFLDNGNFLFLCLFHFVLSRNCFLHITQV